MQPISSQSIQMKDNYYDEHEMNNDYHQMQSQWAKWHLKSKDKLKAKLNDNLSKRVECIENAVDNATQRIIDDKLVPIMDHPEHFRVTTTIKSGALERMNHIIEQWGGVDIPQCEKLPKEFKRYWRLADNWWNRQKGKWFGDLLFWPVLQYNLNMYCHKILINNSNEYHYHAIYFVFLCDIIHSEVQFKKSRPVPLIFDLALQKSANLTQWLKSTGNRHKLPWDLSKKPSGQKGVEKYARAWCKLLRDSLFNQYVRYEQTQLRNDQFTIDNDISIGDSTESKTNNDNDQDIIYPLGQNRALPEPVKPRDPPRPHSRMASTAYSVRSGTTSYNGNGARLPPNYHRQSSSSQFQPQAPQQRAPSMTSTIAPPPINQFLPRPRRRGQLYYLLEMKENKPLTQQQLDELSQQSYISMHTSVDHDTIIDDTSSTTFNGHQPSTPSTTAETPRSDIRDILNIESYQYSNNNHNHAQMNINRPALRIYGNNNNHGQSAPRYASQFRTSSNNHRMSTMSLLTNPSFHAGTSNRYDRNNSISTNGLGHISNAFTSIHQNNNNEMTLDAQCVIGYDNIEYSTNNPYMNTSSNSPNIPPQIEIDQEALNLNPPNHSNTFLQNDNNAMPWNDNCGNNGMSVSNSYQE